eukprot:6579466-Prymnesium_polylepis.1
MTQTAGVKGDDGSPRRSVVRKAMLLLECLAQSCRRAARGGQPAKGRRGSPAKGRRGSPVKRRRGSPVKGRRGQPARGGLRYAWRVARRRARGKAGCSGRSAS